MNDRALADSLIAKLGGSAGLPDLNLGNDGVCSLEFDGELVLNMGFDPADASLVLFAKLPPLEDDKVAIASRLMLEANHFGSGTGGGVFSLAKGTGLPMLARRISVRQTDADDFERIVTDFVGLVELWTKAFGDVNAGTPAAIVAEQPADFMRV